MPKPTSPRPPTGTLTWRDPALMLFVARPVRSPRKRSSRPSSPCERRRLPWHDAEAWLPVYGTLIDIGCLTLLWRLTRREGIGLFDLLGLDRTRIVRDASLGLALVPMSLVFIFGGTYGRLGWCTGRLAPPYFLGGLPLPAGVYGVLVWPFVWGLSEQMTYNGYLLLSLPGPFPEYERGDRRRRVRLVFATCLHAADLRRDIHGVSVAGVTAVSLVFDTLVYLRLRRLLPLAVAHALMDGAAVLIGLVLLPLLRHTLAARGESVASVSSLANP